ncbi:unnamed protein product [Durusdinium trenchii]|uniref:Uncharacterized protein n=1 Tax=Durusdinium trenchii TaxID=1381693 RepID=A0ABP0IJ52_9DINO
MLPTLPSDSSNPRASDLVMKPVMKPNGSRPEAKSKPLGESGRDGRLPTPFSNSHSHCPYTGDPGAVMSSEVDDLLADPESAPCHQTGRRCPHSCTAGRGLVALGVVTLALLGFFAAGWGGAAGTRASSPTEEVQLQETSGCPAVCGESVACTDGAVKPDITTSTTTSSPQAKEVFWKQGGDLPGEGTWFLNVVPGLSDFGGTWRIRFRAQVFTSFKGFFVASVPDSTQFPNLASGNYVIETEVNSNILCYLIPVDLVPSSRLEISTTDFVDDTLLVFEQAGDAEPAWSIRLTRWRQIPGRRLQGRHVEREVELFSNARQLQEFYRCPGGSCPDGCEIPVQYVNDDFCDCSNCADELDWTCGTCGAQSEEDVATGVGVGVGVGTGLALGIGLGVGLGTGLGAGTGVVGLAALAAQGLRVSNGATLQDPEVVNALKETIARLSGSGVAAAMVELIINCANAAMPADLPALPAVSLPDRDGTKARRLFSRVLGAVPRLLQTTAATVGVCFQVQVSDSSAEEICQTLSGYNANTVQTVLSSELESAGIPPQAVSVIGYDATPNPRSYNPLESGDASFFRPASGISLVRI